MTKIRVQRGFALAEVVIATLLIGLVGIAFGVLTLSTSKQYVRTSNGISAQNDAAVTLEHLRRNLTKASQLAPDGAVLGIPDAYPAGWTDPLGNPQQLDRLYFFSDGRWQGYEVVRTAVGAPSRFALVHYPNPARLPNAVGAEQEVVSDNLVSDSALRPFQRTSRAELSFALRVRKGRGSDVQESRISARVAPRGVLP